MTQTEAKGHLPQGAGREPLKGGSLPGWRLPWHLPRGPPHPSPKRALNHTNPDMGPVTAGAAALFSGEGVRGHPPRKGGTEWPGLGLGPCFTCPVRTGKWPPGTGGPFPALVESSPPLRHLAPPASKTARAQRGPDWPAGRAGTLPTALPGTQHGACTQRALRRRPGRQR